MINDKEDSKTNDNVGKTMRETTRNERGIKKSWLIVLRVQRNLWKPY